MLILAAVFIALRVAIKGLKIPVPGVESLYITFDMFVNSVGSMVYGPLVGLLVGAVSDTLGAILFPTSTYFFPYIFVEMSSSFIFGLFLYRSHLTPTRVILTRFSVTVFSNMFLGNVAFKLYQQFIMGKEVHLFTYGRLIKNAVLFPVEALLMVFYLGAMGVVLAHLKLIPSSNGKMELKLRHLLLLCGLFCLAGGLLVLFALDII